MLPKELHQLKYEAISVPQGSVRLVKKSQERKSVTSSSPVPLKTRCVDLVDIEVSSRPKLTGIVRGKVFLHVLRRRPIGCPDSRKRTHNAKCDGYDREQHTQDFFLMTFVL
ncbi:hypothetical protein TNCV_4919081 [Trichonephila clavipes]|nr:hypothetical protein TNCV_4919081 [Trichonephila clavipes]